MTLKKIIYIATVVAIALCMLATCTYCSRPKKSTPPPAQTEATPAQKQELKTLQVIAALERQNADLQAQLATRVITPNGVLTIQPPAVQPPAVQPTTISTPISIIPINRYVPAVKSSPQINCLRTAIWRLEADLAVARADRIKGSCDPSIDAVKRANIEGMRMTLGDLQSELARIQGQ